MPLKAIRCTYPACSCDSFLPSKSHIRLCQTCKHGWVAHALDKLAASGPYNIGLQAEPVSANVAFDVASLMLYGSQAVPIRLKILLDRLFSVLPHDEVLQLLHGFGWSHEDYARGYILLDSAGRMLDKWTVINKDEEYIVVQQFLRFAETRTLAQEIILQETRSNQEFARLPPRTESDIKKFIERNNLAIMQSYNLTVRRAFENQPVAASQLFTGLPGFAPHLAGLHHAAAAAAAAAAAFPSAGMAHPAAPVLLGLKQESCAGAAASDSGNSPKVTGGGSGCITAGGGSAGDGNSPTAPGAATGVSSVSRLRSGGACEPFDLRTKTPESNAGRSPPTSSHGSPVSSLASSAVMGSVAGSLALAAAAAAQALPSGLKVDAYGLPAPAIAALRPDFAAYMEEGAINLSKDASFPSRHAGGSGAGGSAAGPSPKPHGSSAGSMASSVAIAGPPRHHRPHHTPLQSPATASGLPPGSSRGLSVGGGWPYGASFGSAVFVGASGKKRVLCTACNKTFCDKGALKIHYSAVHLKEMHRCTIPGCTMMFSSRRSRNRHSANPNPKLHAPQTPRRPRERLLDVGLGGGSGSLSNAAALHHRALGGSGSNLSQGPSMPNSDDDSCGGGADGVGCAAADDDEVMDVDALGDDDDEDDDDGTSSAYYAAAAAGDSTQGSGGSVDGRLLPGSLSGDRARDDMDDYGDEDEEEEEEEDDYRRHGGSDEVVDRAVGGGGSAMMRSHVAARRQAPPPPPVQHLRSNKRKCLMPTRVAAAVSPEAFNSESDERPDAGQQQQQSPRIARLLPGTLGTEAAADRELESPSSDSSSFAGGRAAIGGQSAPMETPPSDAEVCDAEQQQQQLLLLRRIGRATIGSRQQERAAATQAAAAAGSRMAAVQRYALDVDAKQQQQQSALQALFSSFLPRGGDPVSAAAAAAAAAYWPSKLQSAAAAFADIDGGRDSVGGECAGRQPAQPPLLPAPRAGSESDDSREARPAAAADNAASSSSAAETGDAAQTFDDADSLETRRCPGCSRLFQNQYYMRVHYQTVHLRSMMQPCGGSNAAAAVNGRATRKVAGSSGSSSSSGAAQQLCRSSCVDNDDRGSTTEETGSDRPPRSCGGDEDAVDSGRQLGSVARSVDGCGDGTSVVAAEQRKANGTASPVAASCRTGVANRDEDCCCGDGCSHDARRLAKGGGPLAPAAAVGGSASASGEALPGGAPPLSPSAVDGWRSNGFGQAGHAERLAAAAAAAAATAAEAVAQQRSVVA